MGGANQTSSLEREQSPPGIVISKDAEPKGNPLISAFIWGGKVRPVPTLPYGRWKPATT